MANSLQTYSRQYEETASPTHQSPTTTPTNREPTATPTDDDVLILTDYANEPWQDLWEDELVPAFHETRGIDVRTTYLGYGGHEIRSRVESRIQKGDAHESVTGTLWTTNVGYLLAHGRFAPVTPTVETLAEKNGHVVGEPASVFGEHYVVPQGKYTDTIHYRVDVLEALGLDPPATLETLLHNAEIIDDSEQVTHGFPVPTVTLPERFFKLVLNAHGGHLWRWIDEEQREAEVWFPETEVRRALSYVRDLAQYSPDPAEPVHPHLHYIQRQDSVAQMHFLNGWGAGMATYDARSRIARNTEIIPFPTKKGIDPVARSYPGFDGFTAIRSADTVPGLLAVFRQMYAGPEQAVRYYELEPTRFIPPYADVMEVDAYRDTELFQRYPRLLELTRKARDEIVPLEATSEDVIITSATLYAEDFNILRDMVQRVLVEERTIEDAIGIARGALERRLGEGQALVEKHF